MSSLRAAAEQYLAIRRSLGFKLKREGRMLLDFVSHAEDAGMSAVTIDLAVAWATKPADASPAWWGQRLSIVRCFARHRQTTDPATEVPPTGLLPCRPQRTTPYLLSAADVDRLMTAASTLTPALRAATTQTVIGLLAVTGMRIGETLGLDRGDVDLDGGLITIRHAKFGKSRQLPLHPTTVNRLAAYTEIRDDCFPRPTTPSFFVSTRGSRLGYSLFQSVFRRLALQCRLGTNVIGRSPRPHDVRHSFAVSTLVGWYRDGVDVEARLPLLSTWLGHVNPANTYWYLSAAPELLALAGQRLEHGLGELP